MSARDDFWSRRKARVAAERAAEAEAREAAQTAEDQAVLEEKGDAEILEQLGLPDPDGLSKGDDFSAFMAKAVPDRIRRRALRRLWTSNPALANLDGLIDYGEDFTDKATVIENMQTAYQVGKGMTAHVEELARKAKLEAEGSETEEDIAPEADEPETIEEPEPVMAAAEVSHDREAGAPAPDEDWTPPPRRRMQFSFDDTAEGAT